ncbi:MAG: PP2C family protein-serine/threonine phosphatase [Bacteroidota bacterium]
MRNNLYKTNDPEILLRLKRLEANAVLDVLRYINQAHIKQEQIFKIARNALLAQCNVRKMKFIYQTEDGFKTGVKLGIGKLTPKAIKELPSVLGYVNVAAESHPELHAMGVENIVPVNFKNEVRAWFLVADFAETEAEKENDLLFIETLANVVSVAIENRQLIQEMVQQESLKRELEVAERIQKQLLLTEFDVVNGATIYAENEAHHKIGGDFYDVIPRSEQGFFICIADVAGKGIGAALLMANLQANLRALILSENTLESVIQKLHKILNNITGCEQFVTFFLAHVRTSEGEIDFINAGHNPPVFFHEGNMRTLDAGTIPLGIVNLPMIEEGTIQYSPGDMLFLYTDGLVEQHNEKDEMLGEEPVHELLEKLLDKSPKEIVEALKILHRDFAGEAINDDDITMMAVKF